MREKVKGARDEAEIRVNAERTRVSTKTKANTEALDLLSRTMIDRKSVV